MEPKDNVIESGMQQMANAPQAEDIRKKMAARLREVGDFIITAIQAKINEGEFLNDNKFDQFNNLHRLRLTFDVDQLCNDGLRSEADKLDEKNFYDVPQVVYKYLENYFEALGWITESERRSGSFVLSTPSIEDDLL